MEQETPGASPRPAYCPVCGHEADGKFRRLGEAFCSEAHAVEFAEEVRALAETDGNWDTSERRS